MLDFITQHSKLLNLVINAGMLAVWVLYAQLLFSSYRRQRRPKVLINQIEGSDINAQIMLSNMSKETVFVLGLLAVMHTEDETFTHSLTDVQTHDEEDTSGETRRVTSQGPLGSGSYMRLGTFGQIAKWVSRTNSDNIEWQSLEIRLVFLYGSEDNPIGVRRSFEADEEEGVLRITPHTSDSDTLSSWFQRKQVRQWLDDCF